MRGPVLDHIQVDVVTWILLGLGAVVLVIGYSLRPASPACHPFLLGRQAITARTRNVGESPVYTNASTGGIRSPVRPDKKFKLLQDITSTSLSTLEIANPTSTQWIQPGDKIGDLVNALRLAFDNKLGSASVDVAVLVQDPASKLSSPVLNSYTLDCLTLAHIHSITTVDTVTSYIASQTSRHPTAIGHSN